MDPLVTHDVINQPPPLVDYNVFESDLALTEAFGRECGAAPGPVRSLGDPDVSELIELGAIAGSDQAQTWGRQANENVPVLRSHDRFGQRIDMVEYHPSYHELMSVACRYGLHGATWADPDPGAHVRRAAKVFTWYQVDGGHVCPISMTYSSVPALRHQPDLAEQLVPALESRTYDPAFRPIADKAGATAGMGMTEKQGGSDVRSNSTVAEPIAGDGEFLLTGHKWFCSAPMSDGFLMLAQAPAGLSCFWVPRWTPSGDRNVLRIQRLKDKLGDRSNASSEVELAGTWARLVGEQGRGVRTIIEMVNHTRLDCSIGSASIMRHMTSQALWHAHHRSTFGLVLDQHPLMQNVLVDLVLESEAATASVMRLARTFDHPEDEREQLLARIMLPVIKYWTCKRAPQLAAEALECLGGNGFVEEVDMPRFFRQSPVNGVWEGSGNVICLDVLRAMARQPESIEVFRDEIRAYAGGDARIEAPLEKVVAQIQDPTDIEWRARRLVEQLAVLFQGSLLLATAPEAIADSFCNARIDGDAAMAFGTLPSGVDAEPIIDRALPVVA